MAVRGVWMGLGMGLVMLAAVVAGSPAYGQDPPPSEPPAAPAPEAPPPGGEGQTTAEADSGSEELNGEFRRELRTVEEDVNNLKERVFRSKSTLRLLKELVIDSALTGSRLVLWHVNKLGGGYSLESVQYFMDGKNLFNKVDPGGTLDTVRELKVLENTVPSGNHTLQVSMVLRGKGYGVFSYLRGYQFKLTSSYAFTLEEGRVTTIRVFSATQSALKNFVDRPTIQYDVRTESIREE